MECDVIPDCGEEVVAIDSIEYCEVDGDEIDAISYSEVEHRSPENQFTGEEVTKNSVQRLTPVASASCSSSDVIRIIKSNLGDTRSEGSHAKVSKKQPHQPQSQPHHQPLRKHLPRIIVKPPVLVTAASASPLSALHASQPLGRANVSPPKVRLASNLSTSMASTQGGKSKTIMSMPSRLTIMSPTSQSSINSTTTATTYKTAIASLRNSIKHAPTQSQASTMREVLASIPGFDIKRRRGNKKMSTAAQIEQTREGCIDLETPDSILVSTNLRDLLNKDTFSLLPPLYQYKLVQLLPNVDQPSVDPDSDIIRLNSSSLANEFFARACLEWRERLAEGEFTPENQLKLRSEAEKEKFKLDPWKLKHFEPIWGEKNRSRGGRSSMGAATTATTTSVTASPSAGSSKLSSPSSSITNRHTKLRTSTSTSVAGMALTSMTATATAVSATSSSACGDRPSLKTTIKLRPTTSIATSTIPLTPHNYTTSSGRIVKNPNSYTPNTAASPAYQKRTRIGAVTRSTLGNTSPQSKPLTDETDERITVKIII